MNLFCTSKNGREVLRAQVNGPGKEMIPYLGSRVLTIPKLAKAHPRLYRRRLLQLNAITYIHYSAFFRDVRGVVRCLTKKQSPLSVQNKMQTLGRRWVDVA